MRHLLRHVLITQAHMQRLNGSEIVTLELVDFFLKQNSKVTLLTHAVGEPVLSEIEKQNGLTVLQGISGDVEKLIKLDPPTLAWIHHGVIPRWLLEEGLDVPLVFNHMSSQVAIEYPVVVPFESEISTVSLFNARKIMKIQMDTGLFEGVEPNRIQLFENPAPDSYSNIQQSNRMANPRIAVISNHIPNEVLKLINELKGSFDFTLVGSELDLGASPQRVTPEFLENYDAVISIGKTVQYSLIAGIPVYCYDHFGGPGWISKENIDEVRFDNFSGRGFTKKNASELQADFENGFIAAKTAAKELMNDIQTDFNLSTRMTELLNFIESNPKNRDVVPDGKAITTYMYLQDSIGHYIRAWVLGIGNIQNLELRNQYLTNRLDETQTKLNKFKKITGYSLISKFLR